MAVPEGLHLSNRIKTLKLANLENLSQYIPIAYFATG
jgi:hypothetical protein